MTTAELPGWDRLRHGGLLLDTARLRRIAAYAPKPLAPYHAEVLRRLLAGLTSKSDTDSTAFITFVLEIVCGFGAGHGSWLRGTQIGTEWSRRVVTGESVRPRQLWQGDHGAILPVFIDDEPRLGMGRGRRSMSLALQWLRAGTERLALLTNGRQWRLLFAGLDFEAWCEWDVDLWLEEGALGGQVHALRTLVAPTQFTPPSASAASPLLDAILDSRKGQSELSAALGERVREAVELLVQAHSTPLAEQCADVDPAEIYRAAVRVVMRMVVVLFAESRDLLPRDNALYHSTYGLGGMLSTLERTAARGGLRLRRQYTAWPRVLALFKLVHEGSHHPALPVPAYGGDLFEPAATNATLGVDRALVVFERACFDRELVSDHDALTLLERLTRTRVKVRQGRTATWVSAPVDFSDLSSEYIGILYEGLLDFELRTAPAGDPVIFLSVGNQPALPLSRLEAMTDAGLVELLEAMKDTSKASDDTESARDEPETAADPVSAEAASVGDDEVAEEEAAEGEPAASDVAALADARLLTRSRAELWARRAAVAGGLVPKLRGAVAPEKRAAHESAVARKAKQLVTRVVLPGERFLVRWGGNTKGLRQFLYTSWDWPSRWCSARCGRLAYDPPTSAAGMRLTSMLPRRHWTPKRPEDILALSVCDPACGSGTFPVGALRFLTDALYASLHHTMVAFRCLAIRRS
ncbi:hypothetical protein [Gemmatimonas sp.]|uniref:hypothetical protein n=1 Tax=Gemmatimonas sp. TaxID=1962908 RepID=UPI003DA5D060